MTLSATDRRTLDERGYLILEGEAPEQFRQRRRELDAAVRQLHAERVEVIVTNK